MIARGVLSLLAVWIYGVLNSFLHPLAATTAAQMAGNQFESSDSSYIHTMVGLNLVGNIGVPAIGLLAVLLWIWWKPIRKLMKTGADGSGSASIFVVQLLAVGCIYAATTTDAHAFYQTTDTTEVVAILPNETAFWVPSQGDRAGGQQQLNSEDFLNKNKVSTLLFKVPHMKLSGYNLVLSDPYVPAGRLILVHHTPVHREWTADPGRGTSAANQAIPCQSSEGLNITVEVSLTVSIRETDAAKYLYNFGIELPAGVDRNHPETLFSSTYNAKPLEWVMDNVGRGLVVNAACSEISSRTFNNANGDAAKIMEGMITKATKFLGDRGITVDSMGWAGTFTFDKDVQRAVNDAYIGKTVASALPVLQAQADIDVKRGLAKGLADHGLPNLLPPALMDWFSKMFGRDSSPPTK